MYSFVFIDGLGEHGKGRSLVVFFHGYVILKFLTENSKGIIRIKFRLKFIKI